MANVAILFYTAYIIMINVIMNILTILQLPPKTHWLREARMQFRRASVSNMSYVNA